MPRKKKELSEHLIEHLSSMALTQEEIAAVCQCSKDTIQRNYHEAWQRGQTLMKASIKRRQFIKAVKEGNTTMLIWLGKQHLGQRDNLDLSGDMTHKYFMEGVPQEKDAESWHQQYSPVKKNQTMQ